MVMSLVLGSSQILGQRSVVPARPAAASLLTRSVRTALPSHRPTRKAVTVAASSTEDDDDGNMFSNPNELMKQAKENSISTGAWSVEEFLDCEIELNPLGKIPQKDFYNAYVAYCGLIGVYTPSKRRFFGSELRLYFKVKKNITLDTYVSPIGTVFCGVQFRRNSHIKVIDTIFKSLKTDESLLEDEEIRQAAVNLHDVLESKGILRK